MLLTPKPLVVGRFHLVLDAQFFPFVARLVGSLIERGRWLDLIAGPPERDEDALSLAIQSSADLRTAIHLVCRFTSFWSTSTELRFDERRAVIDVLGGAVAGPERDIAVAVLLGTLARRLAFAASPASSPVRAVRLRWIPNSPKLELEAVFGVPVATGCAADELVLDEETLDRPLPRSWRPFAQFFGREVEEAVRKLPAQKTAVERTKEAILEGLAGGADGMLARVSRSLGVSSRTLQRQLAREGQTFTQVLDSTRLELAQQALALPANTVGEVAFAVGFSDPSSFVRAFRGWSGRTPGSWRDELLAG